MDFVKAQITSFQTNISKTLLDDMQDGIVEGITKAEDALARIEEFEENGGSGGSTEITAESITNALGYTPANEDDIAETLAGSTDDITPQEVGTAVLAGTPVAIGYTDGTYGNMIFTSFTVSITMNLVAASAILDDGGILLNVNLVGAINEGTWTFSGVQLATAGESETELPEVTSDDDGKILQVVDGAWAAAENTASGDVPSFDLEALGLSAIPVEGGNSTVETDTTEIMAALDKGLVKFSIPMVDGESTLTMEIAMSGLYLDGMYQCCSLVFGAYQLTVTVMSGAFGVSFSLLNQSEEKTVTAVDLSAFETSGVITETYGDGSTNTYTFVDDTENNSTTITDSNGNSTVITGMNVGYEWAEEASF